MSLIVVDVEADGPSVGLYSMVCFGAVIVEPGLDKTFYGQTAPITDKYIPEALAVSGFTRAQHEAMPPPEVAIKALVTWIEKHNRGKLILITDNLAFDWQFINYYMYRYHGSNPFGWSGRRIGDIYSGLTKNFFKSSEWKRYRQFKHTHNPVDDAKGNANALLTIANQYGLKLPT